MGVSSSAALEWPHAARHSIRFTFAALVAVPTVYLVLWGLAVSATLGRVLTGRGLSAQNHRELVELVLLAGTGLAVNLRPGMDCPGQPRQDSRWAMVSGSPAASMGIIRTSANGGGTDGC